MGYVNYLPQLKSWKACRIQAVQAIFCFYQPHLFTAFCYHHLYWLRTKTIVICPSPKGYHLSWGADSRNTVKEHNIPEITVLCQENQISLPKLKVFLIINNNHVCTTVYSHCTLQKWIKTFSLSWLICKLNKPNKEYYMHLF